MNLHHKKKAKQKVYYIFDAVLLFVILYFLYNGINGGNGLLNLIKMNNDIHKNNLYLDELNKKKYILNIKNSGLYEENLNLELLEEQAKNFLGYINKNGESVILLNKSLN